ELRGPLLIAPADLPDQDDGPRLPIPLALRQHFDEAESVHRITTDPDARGLAKPALRELVDDLIGEGSGAGNEAYVPRQTDLGGDDAHIGPARRDDPRAVR